MHVTCSMSDCENALVGVILLERPQPATPRPALGYLPILKSEDFPEMAPAQKMPMIHQFHSNSPSNYVRWNDFTTGVLDGARERI